jgi:hypothetical protein
MIQAFSTGLGEPFFYGDTGLNCLSFFGFSMDIFSGQGSDFPARLLPDQLDYLVL